MNINTLINRILNTVNFRRPISNIKNSDLQKEFDKVFLNSRKGASIELNDVTKVYDNGIKAVNSAKLKIIENEFIALLGPSGCGKTTILRMLAGLETISSGLVKFDNNIINSVDPGRRNLAMVFQNYALYPFMTVYKNISFGLKIKSRKNHVYEKVSHEIKELKNILRNQNKLLKHEKKLLENPNLEELVEIDTALKIKKKSKVFDEEYDILSKRKSELTIENSHFENTNKERISELELALKKYRKYLNPIQFAKMEIKGSSENEINNSIEKTKKDLMALKLKNKKIIKEKYIEREKLASLWKANIPNVIEKITGMLGINNYLNRKPAELSGGQRQRVALARAISKNSSLFLYDEPLSNLDAKLRGVMRTEIRRIHNQLGTTSIYVTHDQIEAMTMADRIVVMNSGYIQQIDTPKSLYEHPANIYVATFIGSPEMNMLEAEILNSKTLKINSKKIDILIKESNIKLPNEKRAVIMGIRPNDIITDSALFKRSKNNVIKGKVINLEDVGKEKNIVIETNLGKIRVVYGAYNSPEMGEKVEIMINPTRIHIFDKKDGMSLTSRISSETAYAHEIWKKGKVDRIANKVILFKEKNKDAISNKLWRNIHHLISPKSKKEWKAKIEFDKKMAYKSDSLVDQNFKIKDDENN